MTVLKILTVREVVIFMTVLICKDNYLIFLTVLTGLKFMTFQDPSKLSWP